MNTKSNTESNTDATENMPLNWDNEVLNWHCQYLRHDEKIIISQNEQTAVLKGFKIDGNVIKKILTDERVEQVAFVFGLSDDNNPSTKPLRFTLIIAGLNSENHLIADHLYDFLDPCPSACVDNLVCQGPPPFLDNGTFLPYIFEDRTGREITENDAIGMQCRYMGGNKIGYPLFKSATVLSGVSLRVATLNSVYVPQQTEDIFLFFGVKDSKMGKGGRLTMMFGSVYSGSDIIDPHNVYEFDEALVGGDPNRIGTFICM